MAAEPDHDRDRWQLAFDHWNAGAAPRLESLLGVGNGLLFVRACPPEAAFGAAGAGTHYAGLYRAGGYNRPLRIVNGRRAHVAALVRLPDPFGLSFRIEGDDARNDDADDAADWFGIGAGTLEDFHARLDFAAGVAERRFVLRDAAGRRTRLRELRCASWIDPDLVLLRWQVMPLDWSGNVLVASRMQTSASNDKLARTQAYEGHHVDVRTLAADAGHAAIEAFGTDGRLRLRIDSWLRCRPDADALPAAWAAPRAPIEQRARLAAREREPFQIDLWVRVVPAQATTQALPPFGQAKVLLTAQRRVWQAAWEQASIDAPHDAELERALRFGALHLLQTASPLSCGRCDAGLPSRGWQEGYLGQIFWDQTFAFPFFSLRFPDIARHLLDYRFERLDAACAAARRAGFRGAMFPWRSAATGESETPPFQWIPPANRWKADHTDLQRHIGAAIAFDLWQHHLANPDDALLAGAGGRTLIEIARFWASICVEDEDSARFRIRGVVGPDEYHDAYPLTDRPGLDDNAYTNAMAAWTLQCAARLPQLLDAAAWRALRESADLRDDELARWRDIASRIRLPLLDGDVIEQFDGFDELLPADSPGLPGRGSNDREDWLLFARGDDVNRYQVTKQADVLTLFYRLGARGVQRLVESMGWRLEPGWQQRTVRHYLERISHESSLSRPICAGALAAVGERAASWRFFRQALDTDLDFETNRSTHEGVHLGAMAACWDVLQRFYFGVWLEPEGIRLDPLPPPELDQISLRVQVRGHRLRLRLDGAHLHVDCEAASDAPLRIACGGRVEYARAGLSIALRCR